MPLILFLHTRFCRNRKILDHGFAVDSMRDVRGQNLQEVAGSWNAVLKFNCDFPAFKRVQTSNHLIPVRSSFSLLGLRSGGGLNFAAGRTIRRDLPQNRIPATTVYVVLPLPCIFDPTNSHVSSNDDLST